MNIIRTTYNETIYAAFIATNYGAKRPTVNAPIITTFSTTIDATLISTDKFSLINTHCTSNFLSIKTTYFSAFNSTFNTTNYAGTQHFY
jgi:hypothetical protein